MDDTAGTGPSRVGTPSHRIPARRCSRGRRRFQGSRLRADPSRCRCIIYEPDGTFVRSFGEDVFTERIHALTIDGDDFVYTADDGDHTVRKFSPDGALLMTLGTPGVPSDTGYDGKVTSSITRVGPPFNRPTKAAIGPNGDIFVSGRLRERSYPSLLIRGRAHRVMGRAGSGPGQFNVPHGVWVADDRVFVADRENDRVQIFSLAGELLEIWDHVQRPTDIYVDRQGLVYISSLWWPAGAMDLGGRRRTYDLPGGVYVLDLAETCCCIGAAPTAAPRAHSSRRTASRLTPGATSTSAR